VTGEVSSPFGKSSVTHDVEVEVALGDGAGRRLRGAAARAAAGGARDDAVASFRDRYSESQWTEYCDAFAA
jgi:hypothetical protein